MTSIDSDAFISKSPAFPVLSVLLATDAPSRTINRPVLTVRFPASPELRANVYKPPALPLGLVPLNSTKSEAFTVIFPPAPLLVFSAAAAICAPSRIINRPVSTKTSPPSPSSTLVLNKPLVKSCSSSTFGVPINSIKSEALTLNVPGCAEPHRVIAPVPQVIVDSIPPSRRINCLVFTVKFPASPSPKVLACKLVFIG